MTRSKRKTPIAPLCGRSEKKDKKILHGKFRKIVKHRIRTDPENYLDPHYEEVHNKWSMAKDGTKYYFPKNDTWYEKIMRK